MTTWMVVEDEPDLYEMVLTMYEMLGIEGVAFTDGEEAMTWIEEVDSGDYNRELPELALLDIRLPGKIQGQTVGARLRSSPAMHGMTVVLMTAFKLSAKEEKAIIEQAASDMLLYKPLPAFGELQQILQGLIDQNSLAS